MVSQLKVNEIIKQSGSSITIGEAGDSITFPSTGTASGILTNTPSFLAGLITPGQGVDNNAFTRVVCNEEVYDTNNCYNTSDGFFTPTVAGKYFVYGSLRYSSSSDWTSSSAGFYKNSTRYVQVNASQWHYDSSSISAVIECNGTTDTISFFTYHDQGATQQLNYSSSPYYVYFGGYRIIGA